MKGKRRAELTVAMLVVPTEHARVALMGVLSAVYSAVRRATKKVGYLVGRWAERKD